MTMEMRPASAPQSFDLYDGEERIGEILYVAPMEEYGAKNPECWEVRLWSLTGSGKEWGDTVYSIEEAKEFAHSEYPELVAERRAAAGPSVRVISTPMGGQRRR